VAELASLSAASLPLMPKWLGNHTSDAMCMLFDEFLNLQQTVRSVVCFTRAYSL